MDQNVIWFPWTTMYSTLQTDEVSWLQRKSRCGHSVTTKSKKLEVGKCTIYQDHMTRYLKIVKQVLIKSKLKKATILGEYGTRSNLIHIIVNESQWLIVTVMVLTRERVFFPIRTPVMDFDKNFNLILVSSNEYFWILKKNKTAIASVIEKCQLRSKF